MKASSKKKFLTIHSWVGLKVSVLMFIVCFTGTLATISYELDWLTTSALRIEAQQGTDINWDAIHREVKLAYPHSNGIQISTPLYSNFSSIVIVGDPELGIRRVFVDPYTGKVQGNAAYYASFQRTLRDLHRYLLAPTGGIYLVGPLGIILLISTLTALFFYKRWWQGFFKLRLNAGTRAFWGSLHKVTGLWSIWFLLLIGITGTWYLIEGIISDTGNRIRHEQASISIEDISQRPLFENHIALSEAINIAKSQIDNFTPSGISAPQTQNQPIFIGGYTDRILARERANGVAIDPITGEVLAVRTSEQTSSLLNWVDMADPLHFGNFGGIWLKLVYFVFGVFLCVMTASGIVIFVKRIQNRRQEGWVKNILGGMRYVTFIILLIPIIFGSLIALFSMQLIGIVKHTHTYTLVEKGSQNDFPNTTMYVAKLKEETVARVEFDCFNCIPKKHTMTLTLINGDSVRFKGGLSGFKGAQSAIISAEQSEMISHVVMSVENMDPISLYPQLK
jgi:uncharacterized iron-regulated membrane protein